MNRCCFIECSENDIITQCKFKSKYGDHCYRHRRLHLIEDDMIKMDTFTGLCKDYLKKDINHYVKVVLKRDTKGIDKEIAFQWLKDHIEGCKMYEKEGDIQKITRIQALLRGKSQREKLNTYQCNNDEDFYTYDDLKNVPKIYFYSYSDSNNLRWGFDIRSLQKLISMHYPNPYTTEPVPENVIQDVSLKMSDLKKLPEYEDLTDSIQRDRKALIKQNVVDLFSLIEQSGYTCHVEWFTTLTRHKLKELYKQLEDIWNYRSQLSNEMKRNICPPDGQIFQTPIVEVMHYTVKEDLQELILHEVKKFTKAVSDSDRKLGYMYFLIGLGTVSQDCKEAHMEWLLYI